MFHDAEPSLAPRGPLFQKHTPVKIQSVKIHCESTICQNTHVRIQFVKMQLSRKIWRRKNHQSTICETSHQIFWTSCCNNCSTSALGIPDHWKVAWNRELSSPKGLRAESARAVTGRRCPHSGVGEDFLVSRPGLLTKTGVTREWKVVDQIRWCQNLVNDQG